ncbi:MAG TPA: tyrosine-type recombinase/integrase [Anaerohalosphaeraceae bacterium]|nr:tyrosine-type recombinase/integrase [Anaerohalosphaeraceae bacterium]
MATEKIGIYRRWLESVPSEDGQPVPREQWPQKRRHHWEVRWFGLSGKRYSQSFPTRREAECFVRQMQEKVNHGKSDKPDKILLKDFIEEHKKLMPGQIASSTLYDQMRSLRLFEKFIGGHVSLANIKPRHAEAYISKRIASEVSVATVNKDIRTLKRIFNLAITPRGYLHEGHNPFVGIKQRKKTINDIRYVTVEEYHALLSKTPNDWWKAFLAIAYGCGLRREEILHLTWNDIDFENKLINVRAKKDTPSTLKWEPKDHENRQTPSSDQALQYLACLLSECKEGHAYIFIPLDRFKNLKKKPIEYGKKAAISTLHNINRDFDRICKRAGVAHCTVHDLRRSAITNWAQLLPIQVVQQLAGHSNITTTRKYYLKVRTEDMVKASQIINQVVVVAKK